MYLMPCDVRRKTEGSRVGRYAECRLGRCTRWARFLDVRKQTRALRNAQRRRYFVSACPSYKRMRHATGRLTTRPSARQFVVPVPQNFLPPIPSAVATSQSMHTPVSEMVKVGGMAGARTVARTRRTRRRVLRRVESRAPSSSDGREITSRIGC
jgi:hypothetical protein